MSDNDLIRRGALVKYIKTYQCAKCSDIGLCGHCSVLIALKLIEDAPAVPHEMSAVEFANEFRRMCDAYLNCMEDGDDCPLFTANICSLDELVNIVPVVEQWAREHPEERSEE